MCRSYGKYVRACYATGRHRGEHVPIEQAAWGRGRHLVFGSGGRRGETRKSAGHRCPTCHRPLSRHGSAGEMCDLCRKEKEVLL